MTDEQQTAEAKERPKRKLMACRECGAEFAPERQVQRLQKKVGEELGDAADTGAMEACPRCRRKLYARSLLTAAGETADSQTGGL